MEQYYQFISQQAFTLARRLPLRLHHHLVCSYINSICGKFQKMQVLENMPYYKIYDSGIIKYRIFFISSSSWRDHTWLLVDCDDCNYVIYDGPGIRSPLLASSSTNEARYLITYLKKIYAEFWGTLENCSNTTITFGQDDVKDKNPALQETTKPILCSGARYKFTSSGPYELHVYSSRHNNVWCRIVDTVFPHGIFWAKCILAGAGCKVVSVWGHWYQHVFPKD